MWASGLTFSVFSFFFFACGYPVFPVPFPYLFIYLFIYLFNFWLHWVFVAAKAFSSCGERGLLFMAVSGLFIAVASLVVVHRLQ